MNLLALNLQRCSAINIAIYGNFSAPKNQELVVARGHTIDLLRPDSDGRVNTVSSTPMFAVVRSLLAFRLAGANKDYLVVGSDSGKISILEFDVTINDWKIVHCEAYGKTGCRRVVPGQYLAADPQGRALLIASVEKQKFVYVINRDSMNRLTISSPLEAHKNECLLFSVVGVDVGFDNPVFAMIELEYTEADNDPSGAAAQQAEKTLTYYELDLGLNHVIRRWSEPISSTANMLLAVPGGDNGPSGVIICSENWISFKHQGHVEIRAPIPRRADLPPQRGVLITTGTLHKQKDMFFFMLQSEYGDLYKVTLQLDDIDKKIVKNIIVSVFDTIFTCNSLCITRTGLLFAASEFGNHGLFQFQGIGDEINLEELNSTTENYTTDGLCRHSLNGVVFSTGLLDDSVNEQLGDDSISAVNVAPVFIPSSKVKHLLLVEDVASLAPITDSLIINNTVQEQLQNPTGDSSVQVLALCGRGHRSSLRVLKQGVKVSEIAVSELPAKPSNVWTIKGSQDDTFDKYIVVSLLQTTLVLSIGDTVEEVLDSGFLTNVSTIMCSLLGDNSVIQVYSHGIRHIRANKQTLDLRMDGRRVERASANTHQLVVSFAGGDLAYFELDAAGVLTEMGSIDVGKEISAIDVGTVPVGRVRSSFLAVACFDDSVVVYSLEPTDLLKERSTMTLSARAEGLCLAHMSNSPAGAPTTAAVGSSSSQPTASQGSNLFLSIGLTTGVLVRLQVDQQSGSLTDFRQRFLGSKPVKLNKITINNNLGVMALTNNAWLIHSNSAHIQQSNANIPGITQYSQLNYDSMDCVSSFSSEQCPEGVVCVCGNTLRIVVIENITEPFNQQIYPVRHTPRRVCKIPQTRLVCVVETDHNDFTETERSAMSSSTGVAVGGDSAAMVEAGAEGEEDDDEKTVLPVRGPVPPADGHWASCIRIFDPFTGTTLHVEDLNNNESAMSVCTCKFQQHSDETFIVVGSVRDLQLTSRKFSAAMLHVYRILEGKLYLLHTTEMDEIPMCVHEFQGKLLVGAGKSLRLYELGRKKLLKKIENNQFPTSIIRISSRGDRIYVGDMCESIHFVKYKRAEKALAVFADDTFPRYVTSMCTLDYDTVAAVDKFGNVFVLRLPDGISDDVEIATGARKLWDQGILNGAPIKANVLAHYHLGEAATSIVKTSLVNNGTEVLVVTTITGGLFALLPLSQKDDITFYQHLEMFMRQEHANHTSRDHISYRGYFAPIKNVVDGDLCSRFPMLPFAKQKEFAVDVDRTVVEIMKKLEDTRNSF